MSQPAHILVIDDDDRLRQLLHDYLSRNGYRVTMAHDAKAARRLAISFDFDLVVCDVMMPGEDGLSLTADWRSRMPTPILLLTARGLPEDRIAGLKAGADDYLAKPFEPEELLLRISSILRRAAPKAASDSLTLGACVFDIKRSELKRDGAVVRLAPAEITVLALLAQTPDVGVERWKIAKALGENSDRSVDVLITRLRKKLEADARAPAYLQTVRGVGYRLAPDA